MLDRALTTLIKPGITKLALGLKGLGLRANQVTVAGFLIGLCAAFLIAGQAYLAGVLAIFISRICDALDGALARLTHATDAGGFLDITLDFLFYASIPLAFAVIAAQRGLKNLDVPNKSFYFLGGLTEATETLAFFAAMCVWPHHFATLAYAFAALCAITIVTRVGWGWRTFS